MHNIRKLGTTIRTKVFRVIVHGSRGPVELRKEQVMEILDDKDVHSEETTNALMIGGEKVVSHLQIQGECDTCGIICTTKSIRHCLCGSIQCTRCSRFWSDENRPVCPQCYKSLRWRKLWATLLSPFVERGEK